MAQAYPLRLSPARHRQQTKGALGIQLGLGHPILHVSSLAPPLVDPLPPPQVDNPPPLPLPSLPQLLSVALRQLTLWPHRPLRRPTRRSATPSAAAATQPDVGDWRSMLGLPAIFRHPTVPSLTSGLSATGCWAFRRPKTRRVYEHWFDAPSRTFWTGGKRFPVKLTRACYALLSFWSARRPCSLAAM